MALQTQDAQTVKSNIHVMLAMLSKPTDEEACNYKTPY